MQKKWLIGIPDRESQKKICKIMKLTIALLIGFIMTVSAANTYSQKTRFDVKLSNTTIKGLFDFIEQNSEFVFLYRNEDINTSKKVDIDLKDASINQILDEAFKSEKIVYDVYERQIVIRKAGEPNPINQQPQKKEISGTVSDKKGISLPGVSVVVNGTTTGTVTDGDGKFKIVIPVDAKSLTFSFVGMKSQEMIIGAKTIINVTLSEETVGLDEVVAIGYGFQKRADLTGAISSVTSKSLEKQVASNLNQALQGQIAGVNVQQRDGYPGQAATIRIRGANSLSPGVNNPLYVVDGMILADIGLDINLNDVQSVDILKDASATAIYGSRGANGVVIVTTKRGASGETRVSYDGYVGSQNLIKKLDFLNATEYKDYYTQSRNNATLSKIIDPAIINSPTNTNWSDQVYRTALIQNHTFSIQGGTDQSRYYISANYFKQEGIIRNTDFSRISLRFNGDQTLSKKMKINQSIILSNTFRNGGTDYESVSNGVAWALPTMPVLDSQGMPTVINWPFQRTNPRSLLDLITNNTIGYRVVGNAILNYKILKGLSLVINAGTEVNIINVNNYTPSILRESSFKGNGSRGYDNSISWINENTFNYLTIIGKFHKISAVAGITFQDNKNDYLNGSSTGYVIDGFKYNNLGAGSVQSAKSSFSEYSLLSYLGRINYTYKEKWLLTFSGRYDGSSRLAEGRKYNFFPSAAIAWKMSEENFLKGNNTLSDLKLRASWGNTGSQAVAPYSSLATMSTAQMYLTGTTVPNIGYIPASVSNLMLTWENTSQINGGIDFGLFQNRIQITGDAYKKTTTGLLFQRNVPPTSGLSTVTQNVGAVENKGLELFIKSTNLTGEFKWTTSLTWSRNRAKVTDLGKNPSGQPIKMISASVSARDWFPVQLGQAPFNPFGYIAEGLDNTKTKIIYKDLNKDGVIDVSDRTTIGNFQPKYIFGLNNDFIYKNFDLSIFLQGSVGNDVFNDAMGNQLILNGNSNILQLTYDAMGTKYPIPNADYGTSGSLAGHLSTLEIFNGTYVRVKNITLGYTLPYAVINRLKLKDLRIFVTGTNLLTYDKHYPWYDPEVSAGDDVITGWDRGEYANNKSVTFGVKVTF